MSYKVSTESYMQWYYMHLDMHWKYLAKKRHYAHLMK